ncbi:sushi, von Willebrand factor type A, EGF and pentraxin domain-containing protein 1 isoform X2 [Aethina tumida]|uniref:sushi, von Willebrand factor type A, EGF and pentraxin domain-containing protein 1 isoform X2 n=1 Tax=Aethina tumida TaxID=116153 RepID=UPI0021482789|nr:sushi, von Willebrand factor type A, EGF and pentraxin domain-containing protein 1 isoform X2 [Aethina tumida]
MWWCEGRRAISVLTLGLIILLQKQGVTGEKSACRFPGAPAHSSVVFSDENLGPGSVATYTCERGFELLGPSRRVCEGGQWLPEGIPFCVLNVAAGKAPMQVSTEAGGIPQKAIDGSTSAFFSSETCTLTKAEKTPWWYVNLLEPYMVQLVRLDFGKPCCGANKPATIVVRVGNNRPDLGTNPICNRFTGFLEEGQPLFLPCNPPMPGAFVSVHLEAPTASQLSICEAFVYTDQALPIERCPQFRDQPPGSTATYNGKCYIFYNRQPMMFKDALAFCRSRGGTLVDESNPALQGFISWELWRRHRSDASGQYWMAAVRDPKLGGWNWLNGDEVTVSFWNLPVGNGECARYDGTKGWLWSDTDCNMHLNYICQHQPKACGRPEQPPNSTMVAQDFNVGTTIEYTCDEGHLLVGPSSRTCLETGFYNEFPPVCKRIQCGYPADIANGEYQLVNDSVGYLSRVIYTCDEGYEMIGRAQLACDIDERWNGPPPRCEPILCEPPTEIPNGVIENPNNETLFGSTVEYECKTGYKLVGPKVLTCLANGQYDALPPTCQEEVTTTTTTTTAAPEVPRTTRLPTTKLRTRAPRPSPTTIRATEIVKVTKSRRPTIRTTLTTTTTTTETTNSPSIIIAAGHPQDNEIAGSSNIQHGEVPNVNVPLSVDGERRETFGAKLNVGAIIALGGFGAFVFLAAIITTIVILVRSAGASTRSSHRLPPSGAMPSRWYTLLALPFPDQQIGRREFSRSYRSHHRAGYFSNPI